MGHRRARSIDTMVVGAGQAGLVSELAPAAGEPRARAPRSTLGGDRPASITEFDLGAAGISTVSWTCGFRPGFDWVKAPVLDEVGLPIQSGGLTVVPGLSFIGTPWLVDMGSANLVGLERDAEALAARI